MNEWISPVRGVKHGINKLITKQPQGITMTDQSLLSSHLFPLIHLFFTIFDGQLG